MKVMERPFSSPLFNGLRISIVPRRIFYTMIRTIGTRIGESRCKPPEAARKSERPDRTVFSALCALGLTRWTFRLARCFLSANFSCIVARYGSSQTSAVAVCHASESDASCPTQSSTGYPAAPLVFTYGSPDLSRCSLRKGPPDLTNFFYRFYLVHFRKQLANYYSLANFEYAQ